MTDQVNLDELERLRAEATQFQLETGVVQLTTSGEVAESLAASALASGGSYLYGVFVVGSETIVCHTGNGPNSLANATYIAALYNSAPALIELVQKLEAATREAHQELNREPHPGLRSWRDADRACRHVLNGDPLLPGEQFPHKTVEQMELDIMDLERAHEAQVKKLEADKSAALWQVEELKWDKARAERLFNENSTLRLRIAELEAKCS